MLINYIEKVKTEKGVRGYWEEQVFIKKEYLEEPHWEDTFEQRYDGGGCSNPCRVWGSTPPVESTRIPAEAPCSGCVRVTRRSSWLECSKGI